MTRLQLLVLSLSVGLFLILYLGFDTKPRNIKALETSRALSAESTDIQVLLNSARKELDDNQTNLLLALESQLNSEASDSMKIPVLQQISGKWFDFGSPAIAGFYAQEIAQIDEQEESWSIAGTTYTICIQRSKEEKVRQFCTSRAIQAFENAISINPRNVAHKVNLALSYTENPPKENPMKGITMLLDLNRQDPENVLVLNTLGRLAIKTGQFDRAFERLNKSISIEPTNNKAVCLLAQIYENRGDQQKSIEFAQQCEALR